MALFDESFPPYHPFGSRDLSLGSMGTDVGILQAVYDLMLHTMNPPQGPMGPPVSISGRFDAATEHAVRNVQSYFGLAVDGVAGPETFFAYGQGVRGYTTYGGPAYGSRQLSQGESGGDVVILQNRLNCYRYAAILGAPATGAFNSATVQAVLALKSDAQANGDTGFPANGIAGYGFYDATWLYTLAGGRAIETGRNGFDVAFVQVILKKIGLYLGNIQGYYDGPTRTAVVAFQQAKKVTADGVVGPVTFYQLGLSNAVAAPLPLGISWPPTS